MPTKQESVQALLNQGKQLQKEVKIIEAISCYHQAIQKLPDCAPAYFQLAEIYESQREFEPAIFSYQKVIELEPGNNFAKGRLARLMVTQGDLEIAIAIYQEAIAQKISKPKWLNTFLYQGLAHALVKNDQITEAIAVYQQALNSNSNKTTIQIKLGELMLNQGNFTEAINYYQQAIEQKPDFIDAYLKLAKIHVSLQQYEQGISYYQKVVELDSQNLVAYLNLARLKFKYKNYNAAIFNYRKAIATRESKPKWLNITLYKELAFCLEKTNQVDDAISNYQQAINFKKDQVNVGYIYSSLGKLMLTKGNIDGALSNLQKAVATTRESHPYLYLHYHYLGQALAKKGYIDRAINCYHKVIELKPQYTWVYQHLSEVLESQGKTRQAQHYYKVSTQYYSDLNNLKKSGSANFEPKPSNTRNKYSNLPKKLAFCFLTIGELNHENTWLKFFQGNENLANIYAHSKNRDDAGFLREKQINKRVETTYFRYKMGAELALLEAALSNPENYKFLILSESCIPLQLFSSIYQHLIADEQSYIKIGKAKKKYWEMPGKKMIQIPEKECRKNPQWIILNREHAQMMVDDQEIYPKSKDTIFLEEQYPSTFLHLNNQEHLICNRIVTFADFARGSGDHPYNFNDITNFDRNLLLYAKKQGAFFARKFTKQANLDSLYQGTDLESLLVLT